MEATISELKVGDKVRAKEEWGQHSASGAGPILMITMTKGSMGIIVGYYGEYADVRIETPEPPDRAILEIEGNGCWVGTVSLVPTKILEKV